MKKAILISIKPEWVEKILNGEKTIEVRKSMPRCALPADVYIYCTKSKDGSLNYFGGDKYDTRDYYFMHYDNDNWTVGLGEEFNNLCGKVVAKFTLNKVDKYQTAYVKPKSNQTYRFTKYGLFINEDKFDYTSFEKNENVEELLKKSCLNADNIHKYAKTGKLEDLDYGYFYAWHIDNLEIFDKPMELNQFEKYYDEPDDKKPCCCGRKCKYESYDWCEHQTFCSIDYDGTDCPFLKVTRPPQSWQYVFVEV